MNNKRTRKVICVQGDDSKVYEQIIFVMKDKRLNYDVADNGKIDFVLEAERIITEKVQAGKGALKKAQKNAILQKQDGIQQIIIKKGSSVETLLNLFVMSSCILLVCTILYIMF